MMRGFKIRLYPTKEQEELFWKHIHACRFIWNYMLEYQFINYSFGGKYKSQFFMNIMVAKLRNSVDYRWLFDVSSTSLQIICGDVDSAFQRYFTGVNGKPKFKSKKYRKLSFPISFDNFYFKSLQLVKVEKCGFIRCSSDFCFYVGRIGRGHRLLFKNTRISYINGKWILSFAMECENQTLQNLKGSMGIDLGIKELAVVSHKGQTQVFHNINKTKKMKTLEKRKRYYQRKMDKMYNKNGKVHSKNRERLRLKLCKIHVKQTNIRNNYIHQITHGLIQQKPERVIMESLKVKSMIKNKHLSRYILEQKFYMFIDTMRYKCNWAGIEFILADRFYPSSKTCSCCGHIKHNLKLSDRVYKCENCSLEIDRDINAARNLEKYIA